MAANMDALLRITAKTAGTDSIEQLTKRLIGSEQAATRLTQATKLMGAAFSAVGAADLARRMGDFAKSTLEAGEQSGLVGMRIKNLAGEYRETAAVTKLATDSAKRYGLGQLEAANSVSNLYARLRPMGISLEQIGSTFIGVNNAAKQAGLSTYDAGEAFRQLGQAMGSGRLQGDELRSLMERMPAIGRAIVDVFNDIARSKGLEQISKEKADVLIRQTKEGEKRQTEILKEQASLRIEALRNETDRHLKEIDKRYRRQQQIMEDRFEDQDDAARRSNDRQFDATIDGIKERAEIERKAIDRRFEDRRKIVEDDNAINEAQKTQLLRNLDDEKSAVLKAVEDREESATTRIKDAADARNKELTRLNRDARQAQMEQLKSAQQVEEDAAKASMQRQKVTLEAKLKADIEANKQATATTLANLVASTKVTVGQLKDLGADGLITTDIIVMAMKKLEQIQPPPPTAMQQFTAAMADLRMELGENLLPLLTPGIQLLTGLLRAFNNLPEPIKAVAGSVLVLAGALAAIALPLAGFIGSIKMLAGIGLWTTITGAFTGFLTFMGTTFVPALLAFFSGPAGWITLAVIAVGGMVYAFREPIGNFISWMGEQLGSLGKSISGWLAGVAKTVYGAVDAIKSAIQAGIKFTWDYVSGAVGSVAESLARPFTTAAETIKGVLRMVLQFSANIINGFLGAVNQMIGAVNNVVSRVNLPQLPTFSPVSVPSFEGGGFTGNAPRIGGLDGRGGFPAILHPQETVIDHARTGGGRSTPAAINIPITTGPVYRLPDGTDTVSVADFQAGMQAVAEGVMAQLFTPAGRMALRGA